MKVNKIISIDQELMDKLRLEDNASALINYLLEQHYKLNQEPRDPREVIKAHEKAIKEQEAFIESEKGKIKEMKALVKSLEAKHGNR